MKKTLVGLRNQRKQSDKCVCFKGSVNLTILVRGDINF